MKARSALTGLALVLGMTLPAAAQTPPTAAEAPDAVQLAQAQADAPRPGMGMGERRQGPSRAMHRHGGWHRHKMHRFSLAGLALRHRQELALTPRRSTTCASSARTRSVTPSSGRPIGVWPSWTCAR